jgi:uncharacterized membrane-anchored protein YhcB (DUF1043 family)
LIQGLKKELGAGKETIQSLKTEITTVVLAEIKTGNYKEEINAICLQILKDKTKANEWATWINDNATNPKKAAKIDQLIGIVIDAIIDSISEKSVVKKGLFNLTLKMKFGADIDLENIDSIAADKLNELMEEMHIEDYTNHNDPVDAFEYALHHFTKNIKQATNKETLQFSLTQLVEKAQRCNQHLTQKNQQPNGNSNAAPDAATKVQQDCQFIVENTASIATMINNDTIYKNQDFLRQLESYKVHLNNYKQDLSTYANEKNEFITYLNQSENIRALSFKEIGFFLFSLFTNKSTEQAKLTTATNAKTALETILKTTEDFAEDNTSIAAQLSKMQRITPDAIKSSKDSISQQSSHFSLTLFSTKHRLTRELEKLESSLRSISMER